MKRVTKTNNMEKCSDLDTFDFAPWKEKLAKVNVDNSESHVSSVKH